MEGNVDVFGVGGEEEEIMDYDDGDDLNFSTDSEEEYEKNSDKQQEYPKTPEERITWQEHIRMIHLRSHLNQLAEKLKHAFYNVEKIREELKKCRTHKRQLQSERDSLFKQMEEQESNKAAIYRLRAAHKRVCSELDEEEKLERTIQEQVEKAEYDLALVEAEKGKFILVEEELLQKEQQLAKEKMQSAHVRQQKEQRLAVTARITRMKETRQKAQLVKEEQQRHCKAIKDAERSHEQASKYLKKTLEKMKKQQEVEQERYQCEMQRKMDMLVKLKEDMGSIKDNMKVIRARDKALELERQLEEAAEYQRILDEGGNADQQLNIKKRLNDQAEKKKMFEEKQLEQSTFILNNIIYEEKQLQKRKKQQPQLWNEPAWEKTLRVAPHKQKPVKLLEDYINSSYGEVKGGPELRDMTFKQEDEKQDKEKVVQEDELRIHDSTDSSDDEAKEARGVNLAVPEFEGLWEQQILPPKVTKDVQTSSKRPGASKMDKEILEKVLKKHREHIVVKQIAVGREFHGCSFNSKPEVIHFKDIDVGKTYKKKVVLTNVSYTVNYCRYTGMTERLKDFIKVKFDPPGQMSAGMTCNLVVTFKPMINESLFGEINFLSQTGPFSIPLHCTIKKCDLHLDVDQVDFGTAVIGETLKRSITLSNLGGLGTKFDFFKVTGMKQHTFTTGETSLGRLTSDSLHGVSADSEMTPEKVGQQGLFDIAEDLQEVPVSTEVVQQTSEILQAEGSELADTAAVDTEVLADSEKMGPRELPEGASPDLAVSEVDCNLDGMRVGSVTTGEIGPLSSVQLDIIWHPTIPGQVQSEFLVTFADTQATSLAVSAIANGIDVPVWVERQSVDLKICVFDRLYQDTIIINNRATTALKLKFEVCRELHNYMEILPRTGYIQAQSQFSTQLKFLPRKSLAEDSKKYFDAETGVLEAPVLIFVADQTNPVSFAVQAVVTNSDMEFDVQEIDFGHCTVYESVCTTIQLTNKSILPQHYGFLGLPEYVEVQPNDGFGTLLPLETIKLDVIFSPQKAYDYKFDLICKSVIDRDFKISCKGVGVLPPLQLSSQVIRFAATAVFDVSTASLHVINSHKSTNEFAHPVPRIGTKGDICPVGLTSFEFVVPQDAPVSISPSVGTVAPGKKALIQVRFRPSLTDDEIQQEMLRLKTKMEALQLEQDEKLEKDTLEQTQKTVQRVSKQTKAMPSSPKTQVLKSSKAMSSSSLSLKSKQASSNLSEQCFTAKSSPLHAVATASLLRQFEATVSTVVIPCYIASREPSGKLSHSIENTLYLEVRCPVVKPQLIVISDSGKTTVDFSEVSIGQSTYRSVTIQNISDKMVKLSSTILDTLGPFVLVNALRVLAPEATHTLIISFTPTAGHIFQEPLQVKTGTSSLHLMLVGRGVSPVVRLSVENQLLDMGPVLVNEYVEKSFKIENTSSVAIDYVIKLDSLSYSHHSKAQSLPHFLHAQSTLTNYVGVQNYNGQNVFDVVPAEGTIPPGETKDIMVTFAPDHESIHYSDGIHIELFSEKESHFFQVTGESQKTLLFIVGGDALYPDVESLGVLSHSSAEEVSTPVPFLLTLKSQMRNEEFVPATATIFVCCARSVSTNQKKNGEFQFEGTQQLLQKGINIEPSKAMVEAGIKKPVVITWTPPQGHNSSKVQEELVTVTLRGDVVEQQQFVLHLLVVSA